VDAWRQSLNPPIFSPAVKSTTTAPAAAPSSGVENPCSPLNSNFGNTGWGVLFNGEATDGVLAGSEATRAGDCGLCDPVGASSGGTA